MCEYCLLSRAAATHFIQNIDAIGNHTHAHTLLSSVHSVVVCVHPNCVIQQFVARYLSPGIRRRRVWRNKYSLEPDALASTDPIRLRDSGGAHRPANGIKNRLKVKWNKNTTATTTHRWRENVNYKRKNCRNDDEAIITRMKQQQ